VRRGPRNALHGILQTAQLVHIRRSKATAKMVYAKSAQQIWWNPSVVRQHARAHTLLLAVAWKVLDGKQGLYNIVIEEISFCGF